MISAVDEYTHQLTHDVNFNESMYFQFHDPARKIAGFLRLANRPNEGRGERTVCLYLPDGTLGFGFDRPQVLTNESMAAGGLTVEVVEPLDELRVTFDGAVRIVSNPRAMADPKAALGAGREVQCRITLRYLATAPAHEQTFDADGKSFAPHHYEQLAAVTGDVCLGEDVIAVTGHGLRDHSWGPRSWQAPWFYRWMHGSTEGFGFMVAYFGEPDGTSRHGGFVFDRGTLHACDHVTITTIRDSDGYQQSIIVLARSGDLYWRLHGDAVASVPLRHRSTNGAPSTRIVESAMRWRTDDGVSLCGMAEYLDQLDDGQPVGLHV